MLKHDLVKFLGCPDSPCEWEKACFTKKEKEVIFTKIQPTLEMINIWRYFSPAFVFFNS